MNLKMEMFALQYVKTAGDISAATEAMGITTSLGRRYLKREEVTEYISTLNKDIEKVCKINKASVVQKHLEIHNSAMEGDPVKVGEEIHQKPDRSAANRALENVSTLLGYNAPQKVDVNVDLSVWLSNQAIETEIIDG